MRSACRLLIVCALAALAVPATASAHASLLHTSPADGAVLPRAPQAVIVEFDDTVRVGSGNAVVDNATRASVVAGAPRAHGRTLTIPLRRQLRDGDYTARWSIVSDDGHREQGVIAFAIGAGAAPPTAALTASAGLGWWAVAFRVLFYLGLLTAGGVTVFALRVRHLSSTLRTPLAHVLFFALVLAFLGCSGVVHAAPAGTRNALVLQIALGLSIAGAAAAALAPRTPALLDLAYGCSLALVAAPTFSGHALDANQPHWLSVPADLAHTAAAAVWLGGLVALLTVVPRLGGEARAEATRRVSSAAFVAVPVLAAGGLLRAGTELTAVDQAWTTGYGRALLVKTAIFVPLVALGWLNRTRLLALAGALRRTVRVEIVLIAIVVGAVGALVQLRPGRDAPNSAAAAVPQPPAAPDPGAVVDAREVGSLAVGVARTPGIATVTLLGPEGSGVDGRAVTIDGSAARSCGSGCYRAQAPNGALRVTVDAKPLVFLVPARAPAAAVLLRRVTRAYRTASSVVFDESLRSGPTGGIVTRFTVKAPDELGYRIRGGAQAVVIGARRWDRTTPTGRWVESQQTPLQVTQPYWRRPTNVHLVAPGTLTFFDPTIPAWFRLTLGARDRPARLHMTATAHFMVDRFRSYDAPVELSPPSR